VHAPGARMLKQRSCFFLSSVPAHSLVSRPGTVQPNQFITAHCIFFPAKSVTKSYYLWTSKIRRIFSKHANWVIQIFMDSLIYYLSNGTACMLI
jgi:hypothetical protein